MDPDHPSEALLPTFDHDAVSVVLVPAVDPSGQARLGWVLAALMVGLGAGIGVPIAMDELLAGLVVGGMIGAMGALSGVALALRAQRIHLTLGASTLTIRRTVQGRTIRTRTIALRDVRTAHAVDTGQGQGQSHRGLRLALDDGEEVFFGAASVPVAALEWLAAEIRGVAGRARSEPIGEVAPELVELVSEESRKRIEAARRASAARRQTG